MPLFWSRNLVMTHNDDNTNLRNNFATKIRSPPFRINYCSWEATICALHGRNLKYALHLVSDLESPRLGWFQILDRISYWQRIVFSSRLDFLFLRHCTSAMLYKQVHLSYFTVDLSRLCFDTKLATLRWPSHPHSRVFTKPWPGRHLLPPCNQFIQSHWLTPRFTRLKSLNFSRFLWMGSSLVGSGFM